MAVDECGRGERTTSGKGLVKALLSKPVKEEPVVTIEEFAKKLTKSMEEYSPQLKNGIVFLPEFLKGGQLENIFAPVTDALAKKLGLERPKRRLANKFLEDIYGAGKRQIVDFVFTENGRPIIFFELESLDRSQLYLFSDGGASAKDNDIDNKLWCYYNTLGKHYTKREKIPKYFVFFLVLPDRSVTKYQLWDLDKHYQLYDPSLKTSIFSNPYRFFDRMIKTLARAFLRAEIDFFINGKWSEVSWDKSQQICELIFITCTFDRLVMSRGRDFFDPQKEQCFEIDWLAATNRS